MKRIALLTSGRQDWGILRSTAALLLQDPRFELRLLVGGMHCSPRYGLTERVIRDDGFPVAERLDWLRNDGDGARATGQALELVAAALKRQQPDSLVLVGDRSEIASAAIAATIEGVPIVHLHGGEETAGAFDNALRNAITKLAHLHLVSHSDHAMRVIAMGERPELVHVVGAPGLDNLWRTDLPDRVALETDLGISLEPPVVLVTVQPTTLGTAEFNRNDREARAVADAMDLVPATYVVTLPNDDPGHEGIRAVLREATSVPRRLSTEALGDGRYWGMLRIADAILGNSSSGLIEAAAVQLPAVNVGERQLGRLRGRNVIDVDADPNKIARALSAALDPATRRRLASDASPYGDGHSGPRIIKILAEWSPPRPPRKEAIPLGGQPLETAA